MKRLDIAAAEVMKKFTEEDRDIAPIVFYSMDDKAKISVGEPYLAVGFGGRDCRIILLTNVNAVANDYYFKVVSLTPSDVTLRVHMKPDEEDDTTSYYGVMFL
jgi:hypothetical protein